MAIEIGKKAPKFTALTENETTINLSDFIGKTVILFFYPKDDTTTCTAEACSFRDNKDLIVDENTVVLGISPDSPKSHQKFISKYDLNFTLLSDESKKICKTYGVWVEKSLYGRKYMGVERTTFIIDKKGKITFIYNKVKVKGHVEAILKDLKKL